MKLNVTIPANSTATLYLPTAPTAKITEGGKPTDKVAGVQFVKNENDTAICKIGSGSYSFEVM